MFKRRQKQFCVLRHKKKTPGPVILFSREGEGFYSPKRVTNFVLKSSNPRVVSRGLNRCVLKPIDANCNVAVVRGLPL